MRRTRYRFIVNEGRRIDALAYSREQAFRLLETMGYYNIEPVKAQSAARVPTAGAKWAKVESNIREAAAFYGLTLRVQIKLTGHRGGRRGAYSLRRDRAGKLYHHITVKNWLDPEQAGRTLWHELCHAMQAERHAATPDPLTAWANDPARKGAYFARPVEVEARSYEHFNNELPLGKAV